MGLSIDISLYYRQKEASQRWFRNQGKSDVGYTISTLSSSSFVPCIVIACWIGEINGFDDSLRHTLKTLIDFYGYTSIENAPENFPKDLFKVS